MIDACSLFHGMFHPRGQQQLAGRVAWVKWRTLTGERLLLARYQRRQDERRQAKGNHSADAQLWERRLTTFNRAQQLEDEPRWGAE